MVVRGYTEQDLTEIIRRWKGFRSLHPSSKQCRKVWTYLQRKLCRIQRCKRQAYRIAAWYDPRWIQNERRTLRKHLSILS